jgi:hypothetical protein
MNTTNEGSLWKTRDLEVSAFLMLEGFKLESISLSRGYAIFLFKGGNKLNKCLESFWTKEIACNPKELIFRIRELRDAVDSIKSTLEK